MSLSRLLTVDEACELDHQKIRNQLINDHKKISEQSLHPSELRKIFSRMKCCKKNCMVSKLKMPLTSEYKPEINNEDVNAPLSGNYFCVQSSPNSTVATIEQFEHMVWQARDVVKNLKKNVITFNIL